MHGVSVELTDGTGIAEGMEIGRPSMTKNKWLLLGAVIIGVLVLLYFMFLCPTDCH